MRDSTVARSYAEALFEAARGSGNERAFADAFEAIEKLLRSDPRVVTFLATPKISAAAKKQVLRTTLRDVVPQRFLNFLMVVLDQRRQRILPEMGDAYRLLLDEHLGQLHVRVTLAHEPNERTEEEIVSELSRILGRRVVPSIEVDPAILGGIVVRYGDRILDASLRRRLVNLRHRLLQSAAPQAV